MSGNKKILCPSCRINEMWETSRRCKSCYSEKTSSSLSRVYDGRDYRLRKKLTPSPLNL